MSAANERRRETESGEYRTIVIDPPWDMGRQGDWQTDEFAAPPKRDLPYPTMTLDEIAALTVGGLAAPTAHLYVWTVDRYVEATYGLVRGWGFEPNTLLTWAKTPMGLGPGGAFAQTSEHVLFATRGPVAAAGPSRMAEEQVLVTVQIRLPNLDRPALGAHLVPLLEAAVAVGGLSTNVSVQPYEDDDED